MKIVFISDTHNRHGFTVPEGDVLAHTGDFTVQGKENEIIDFARWIEALPHKHKLVIAGNHDRMFELEPEKAQNLLAKYAPSVTYLQDQVTEIEGFKIYGSPWTSFFHSDYWRFHYKPWEAVGVWDKIPDDVNILLTHGPAHGTLDLAAHMRAGCEALTFRLTKLKQLKVHAFGHIHEGYGIIEREGSIRVNAAICDLKYNAVNAPIVVDLEQQE